MLIDKNFVWLPKLNFSIYLFYIDPAASRNKDIWMATKRFSDLSKIDFLLQHYYKTSNNTSHQIHCKLGNIISKNM